MRAGLRLKVFGALFTTTLISLALVYGLTSQVHLASQEEEELSRAATLARVLAGGLQLVDLESTQQIDDVLMPLKQDSGVVGLFVLSASGIPRVTEEEQLLADLMPLPEVVLFISSNESSRFLEQQRPDGSQSKLVAAYAPIGNDDAEDYRAQILFVVLSASQRMERVELSNQFIVMSMGLGLIIVLMVGYLAIGRIVVQPVQSLVRVTRKIEGEQEGASASRFKGDELEQLGKTLQRMQGELKEVRLRVQLKDRERQSATEKWKVAEESLERSERLASVGVLTAGFAHEIGNPMGVLQGYVELLEDPDCTPEERSLYLERMKEAVGGMDRVLRELLRYSRPSPRSDEAEQTDFKIVLDGVLQLLRMESRFRGVEVSWQSESEGLLVEAERGRLEQVLMNLLLNAGDAMDSSGSVKIRAEESGPYWDIHLVDSGPGIPDDALPKLFDPFFTTKSEGVGTGLGLAISRRIINSFGGDIHASNNGEGGACFTIRLYRAGA